MKNKISGVHDMTFSRKPDKILFAIILPFFIVSCGKGELSRSDAAKQLQDRLITKRTDDDIKQNDTTRLGFNHCHYKQGDVVKISEECKKVDSCPKELSDPLVVSLKNKGMIDTRFDTKYEPSFLPYSNNTIVESNGGVSFEVTLTDEGRKYKVGNKELCYTSVIARHPVAVEILAIGAPTDMGGKKVSVVNYTVKYEMTPFGDVLLGKDSSEEKGEALFALYDNGWKLEGVH